MGQPVNPLLGNQQALLGADPELYRQQLIQQEQARIGALPAQSQLGAQLGSLLGRGLVNVAQDRGFFEVTNPVLQRLTSIQNVYNTAMQNSDPNDPLSFYKNLQTGFAEAGLGQQALMATQELRRVEAEGEKARGEKLKTQVLETELYTKNPQLLDEQIAKARDAGNDTLANRLAEQRGQIQINIDTQRSKDLAEIALRNAQTDAQRASARNQLEQIESGKYDWKVITNAAQIPVSMAKIDKKTGATTYEPIPPEALGITTPPAGAAKPATSGGRATGVYNPQTGQIEPVK
jgi:uncharacterized tellurite resistance protein B-like protein